MTKRMKVQIFLAMLAGLLALAACTAVRPLNTPKTHVANPASENCAKQGGTLKIETAGDSSQYGLCMFSDTMACEEWALMNGDCPVGGVDISSSPSEQVTYCLVTGNQYTTMDMDTAPPSTKELCILKSGKNCDVLDFYTGRCKADPTSTP